MERLGLARSSTGVTAESAEPAFITSPVTIRSSLRWWSATRAAHRGLGTRNVAGCGCARRATHGRERIAQAALISDCSVMIGGDV